MRYRLWLYIGLGYLLLRSLVPGWMWSRILLGGSVILAWAIRQLYIHQDKILYHPNAFPQFKRPKDNPEGLRNPSEWGMQYEDAEIVTDDKVKIHAWTIVHMENARNRPTIIYFQGNAGSKRFHFFEKKAELFFE